LESHFAYDPDKLYYLLCNGALFEKEQVSCQWTSKLTRWVEASWLILKTVILTGGSQGMGKEVARLLASKGANVVIVARGVAKLQSAVEEIKVAPHTHLTLC
jgi:hypothetical protein